MNMDGSMSVYGCGTATIYQPTTSTSNTISLLYHPQYSRRLLTHTRVRCRHPFPRMHLQGTAGLQLLLHRLPDPPPSLMHQVCHCLMDHFDPTLVHCCLTWFRPPRDSGGPEQDPVPASVPTNWLRCLTWCRPPRDPGGPELDPTPASLAQFESVPGLRVPAGTSPERAFLSSVAQAEVAVELGTRLEAQGWTRQIEAGDRRMWYGRL